MAVVKAEKAKQEFEKSINLTKLLTNTYGLWLYDIKSKAERTTLRDTLLMILRTVTLVYDVYSIFGQLMYIILIAIDLAESLETLFSLFVNIYCTAISFNLFFRHKQMLHMIETLKQITNETIYNENCQKMVTKSVKMTNLLTICHWFVLLVATVFYMVIPLLYLSNNGHQTDQRPLPYNAWYPYDKNKSPYYEISYFLEVFRGCGILNILAGNDCLFIFICYCTFGHFNILKEDFQDIYERAQENVKRQYGENDLDKLPEKAVVDEANALLKRCINRHIKLLEVCTIEEGIYSITIFFRFLLHSSAACFVGYLIGISIVNNDFWNSLRYIFAETVLFLEVVVQGYVGSELIHASTDTAHGCFYSKWYRIRDTKFKNSLLIAMQRAQKPCRLTALGFTNLSLEFVVRVFSSAISYFTLLNAVETK